MCLKRLKFIKKISIIFISKIRKKVTIFLKNQFFDFLIYPWWISVITGNGFMGNLIRYYILKGLNKQFHLFVYADIYKTIVSRKFTNCLYNLVNMSPLIMPDFPILRLFLQTLCGDNSLSEAKNELQIL